MTRARELSRLGDTNVLSVDSSNNVGINSTIPDAKLDVVGVVSATSFYGDGSELDGIIEGATLSAGSGAQRVVVTSLTSGTMTAAATDADLSWNSSTNTLGVTSVSATNLTGALVGNVTGNITGTAATFTGNVSIGGTLTYEDVTNIDSVGIITAQSGIRVGAGESISPVSGTLTYYGDGSQLSGISAGISTVAGTSAGIVTTLYLSSAQDHKMTASGISTITCSGGTEGDSHTVRITNSGITTIGFSTYFLWPSGSAPSIPTADGAISLISFTVQRVGAGGTQLLAGASLNFS